MATTKKAKSKPARAKIARKTAKPKAKRAAK